MTPLSEAMHTVFIVAWFVCAAGCLYANRYFLPMWFAGFRKTETHKGYWKKVGIGFCVSLPALIVMFGAGGIAEVWGGGWP